MAEPNHPEEAERDVVSIPIVSEQLSVEKRVVERRRIRINKSVTQHSEVASALLNEDVIEVTRRPVDRVVDAAPGIREEGDLLIVPVLEEVLVVEKRLVLKEEIVVRRQRVSRPFEEEVILRREEVRIDGLDSAVSDKNIS